MVYPCVSVWGTVNLGFVFYECGVPLLASMGYLILGFCVL